MIVVVVVVIIVDSGVYNHRRVETKITTYHTTVASNSIMDDDKAR